MLFTALLELSTTLSPKQNVVGPCAVTIGAGGKAFTRTESDVIPDAQLFASTTNNEKVPLMETVILCVVSPVLH